MPRIVTIEGISRINLLENCYEMAHTTSKTPAMTRYNHAIHAHSFMLGSMLFVPQKTEKSPGISHCCDRLLGFSPSLTTAFFAVKPCKPLLRAKLAGLHSVPRITWIQQLVDCRYHPTEHVWLIHTASHNRIRSTYS